jgi:anti-sigma regulatory factor (Ser/Thr protein kinase)
MALDEAFDVNTLHELRKAVLAEATAAGMPDGRAMEVVLAVHELAANAVRHGGGTGRARVHVVAGGLRCQVSDPGKGSADGDPSAARRWPVRPGHGLWLVRNTADHLTVAAGPCGSLVTVVFALPAVPRCERSGQG